MVAYFSIGRMSFLTINGEIKENPFLIAQRERKVITKRGNTDFQYQATAMMERGEREKKE